VEIKKDLRRRFGMSNVHELSFLKEKIQELKDQGVYRKLPVLESPSDAEVILNGKRVINLSSNNYLGFANHPRLKKAAIEAVEKYGAGAGAVRTIIGNMAIHEELEDILAKFKREEAAFLYQSGFNCNAGTIQAITEAGDIIISDELNHASIIDGSRLSKAARGIYKHSDMDSLEAILKESRDKYKNILVITDGVFSMDGDIAKLPEIVELAEKYEAMTYVDDAHGSGVLGESGRGTVDHFGLHGRVDFSIGTLSKAIGVVGGYVAGSETMYEWLNHRARPVLFSTSLPPAAAGAIIEALKMLMESTEYTDRLWENARYFKGKLGKLGFNTGHSETPITPVIIGDEGKTMEFSRKLLDNGVFVSGIVFPTVPKGTGRVRCMVSAAHSKENLDEAVRVFELVGKEMGIL
jgi:glycine C-acetyltransferase